MMIFTISVITYNQNIINDPLWGAAPSSSLLYLYLPNCHANVVRYDDLSSRFKLWYPKLASIRERYCILFNFGNISLTVGPLCTGLCMKLLHHSAVSAMRNGAMKFCCCRYSNSSLNYYCRTYATHLGGAWYGLLSGLTCIKNVPLKHLLLLNACELIL